MARKGLVFLHNVPKSEVDTYVRKGLYRYIHPDIVGAKKMLIEIEVYPYKICVLSFYAHGFGEGIEKYQVRLGMNPGQILGIFSACMDVYDSYANGHALVFSGANDLGKVEEDNKRFSCYIKFLRNRYRIDEKNFKQKGAFRSNSFLMMPPKFLYVEEAEAFFKTYQERVLQDLNNSGSQSE